MSLLLLLGNQPAALAEYTLSADTGTYSINGTPAGITVARILNASAGSYAVTGFLATFSKYSPLTLNGQTGEYSLTGFSTRATLEFDMIIGPDTNAIANAVLASLQVASPPIPVNTVQMNSNVVTGTGQETDKWRAVGVPN